MDAQAKKSTLRMITYGLYVATAADGEEIAAGTINWLSQTSFEPPLVMIGIKVDSTLHTVIENSQRFAVNLLADDQKNVAQSFFKLSQISENTINGYAFERGKTGAPLLTDVPAQFEAEVVDTIKRGDHTIFVGEVVDATVREEGRKPLVMWDTGWSYGG